MIDERAKQMVEARCELQEALRITATVLNEAGRLIGESSAALQKATEREATATLQYITALESALSEQRALS
jgi:hypothetical protein